MATISINVPDTVITRVVGAFASAYRWDGTGTKAAFLKTQIAVYIKEIVLSEERKAAIKIAEMTVDKTTVEGIS